MLPMALFTAGVASAGSAELMTVPLLCLAIAWLVCTGGRVMAQRCASAQRCKQRGGQYVCWPVYMQTWHAQQLQAAVSWRLSRDALTRIGWSRLWIQGAAVDASAESMPISCTGTFVMEHQLLTDNMMFDMQATCACCAAKPTKGEALGLRHGHVAHRRQLSSIEGVHRAVLEGLLRRLLPDNSDL